MISKRGTVYRLVCDVCRQEVNETFCEFDDAAQYKKNNYWKSQRRNGEWEDICPYCQEMAE